MHMINYKEIEEKWQRAWDEARLFEAEPNEKEPILITAAFPYVNSPLHIGHLRTYATTDLYARYMRMKGYNVLFPFAFHASGTPVLAMAKRISQNDTELIEDLKAFGIGDEDISKMGDPKFIAEYFKRNISEGMHRAGLGVDWRRSFVSTDPIFSKMVEWQFHKLKELGYLEKGVHPVGWCTNDGSAVGQHDTKHDVHPEIESMTVIGFKDTSSDTFFPCATYRPETVYAVTNVFVKEGGAYVRATLNGKSYYMSKAAAEMLALQAKIEVNGEISSKELLGKSAVNPVTKETVPVLPGFFIKEDVGTGVVMSVPAHAPFDYAALERLKVSGYPMPKMEYRKIIEIERANGIGIGRSLSDVSVGEAKPLHPEIPALAYLEILHTDPNAIDDMLEFATKLIYREESHWGVMLVDKYKGMREPEARDMIRDELTKAGDALSMYVIGNSEPVYCRCGTRVLVKVVDQWFINYGSKEWKEEVRGYLPRLSIFPRKLRAAFNSASEWMDLRATERAQGLGTRFPFDKSHIIESLSDSTIYPTLYTYVHILYSGNVKPEQLNGDFFDYVLLGKGELDKVAGSTGTDRLILDKCRESFKYWYRNTSRHSGPDLIYNHYTMYIYNHVAILPEEFWPKQVVVNGMVNYEGEKMSKSLNNIVPLNQGMEKFGADPLKFVEIAGGDLDTDTEFNMSELNGVVAKNQSLYDAISRIGGLGGTELTHIDYWLYSKLNSKIKGATASMDEISLRSAYIEIFYNSISELRWYGERGGGNPLVVKEFLDKVVLMLSPIMPHFAEEMWHALGNSTLAAKERWPSFNEHHISREAEAIEEMIKETVDDAASAIALTSKMKGNSGKAIKAIKIIIAEQWKAEAYNALVEKRSISEVMAAEGLQQDREKLSGFLSQFSKRLRTLERDEAPGQEELFAAFSQAAGYLGRRLGATVEVEREAESQSQRAQRALPGKPSIDVIWS